MTSEKVQVQEDYYVILLAVRTFRADETYFKADRYSPYTGRLQVENDVKDAQHFKTEKGARQAIARLLGKGTIKDYHNPRIVRYQESVIRRWTEIQAEAICDK